MAVSFTKKKEIVEKVTAISSKASLALAAEYHSIKANDMNVLRGKARQQDVSVYVVKNSLAKRALQDTPYECLSDGLKGPLMLMFSNSDTDAPAAARLVRDFGKENESIKVKLVALSGELREVSEVDKLADLPTREQAIALLLAVIKEPISKFVRVLSAPHTKLVRTFDAVRVKKQESQ